MRDHVLRAELRRGGSRSTGTVISLSRDEFVEFFGLDECAAANLDERQVALLNQSVKGAGADPAQPLPSLSYADEPPLTPDLRRRLSKSLLVLPSDLLFDRISWPLPRWRHVARGAFDRHVSDMGLAAGVMLVLSLGAS